jgi:tRNA-specific 2-thiouridylase
VPITLSPLENLGDDRALTMHFDEPELGVAPGQAAVIYAGTRVVGGGWIASTTSEAGESMASESAKEENAAS